MLISSSLSQPTELKITRIYTKRFFFFLCLPKQGVCQVLKSIQPLEGTVPSPGLIASGSHVQSIAFEIELSRQIWTPPNQFPPNLFSGKFVPPRTFSYRKFGPLCHCVSFEQTIVYTWSIHTKEAIHNKFEVVYSSITHKEQNKSIFSMSS